MNCVKLNIKFVLPIITNMGWDTRTESGYWSTKLNKRRLNRAYPNFPFIASVLRVACKKLDPLFLTNQSYGEFGISAGQRKHVPNLKFLSLHLYVKFIRRGWLPYMFSPVLSRQISNYSLPKTNSVSSFLVPHDGRCNLNSITSQPKLTCVKYLSTTPPHYPPTNIPFPTPHLQISI